MYKAVEDINQKDYFRCNMYYMKKYISMREIILLSVLLAAAIVFWIIFDNLIIMIMFAVTLFLMGAAILLYVVTALAAYKTDFAKRGITRQILTFFDWGFTADSYDKGGDLLYSEKHLFKDIDKAALLKNTVYIFAATAVFYYIQPNKMSEGNYEDFRMYLFDSIEKTKFKMKTKTTQFPSHNRKNINNNKDGGING